MDAAETRFSITDATVEDIADSVEGYELAEAAREEAEAEKLMGGKVCEGQRLRRAHVPTA